jgi:hypothetical protein
VKTRRSGAVLVLFLGLMTVGLIFAVTSLSFQAKVLRNAKQTSSRQDSTYVAEAGLEKGLNAFLANQSYTGSTVTAGNGSAVVTVTAGATSNEKILSAVATVNNQIRRVRVKLATQASGVAVAFRYALQAGDQGIDMGNGSSLTGNLYSNQNITAGNGASVTGGASAVGTISNNLSVGGQKLTGQPVQALPAFDANFWRTKAQAGTTINGSYSPASNTTIGPLYVTGSLSFGNGVNVTIRGPVYVAGAISFGNGVTLTVDSSLAPYGVMMIADGPISFGNGLTVSRPNGTGYVLLTSNSTSTSAISMGNGTTIVGAPLFTPNGGISIGNSAHAVAFAGRRVTIGNSTVVTYDQGLASASFTSGPSGTWTPQKGTYQEY